MSNVGMFKYSWVWDKVRASNFFAAKFQPLNNTEDIVVFSTGGCNNGTKNPVPYQPQGLQDCNRLTKNSSSVGGKVGDAHKTSIKRGGDYLQTATGYPSKVVRFIRDNDCLHPTQKPVALIEYLIRTYTNEGQTVLDFTMGSGTTGVACVNTNRSFIGIELDKGYFNIAQERISKAQEETQQKVTQTET
jgi:site-specific DNA-methyltransferase (adenine-specific)